MLRSMRLVSLLAGLTLVASFARAHHSQAGIFDSAKNAEITGVIKSVSWRNPHGQILLTVKDDKGATVTWSLEGGSPSALVREGWTSRTVKPGDEIKIQVKPLRSGAPGGAWEIPTTFRKDGSPLGASH